eukprot:INCI16927.1.p1 GENE.INCI16927.1~~INCI16927.1.p1  ORF type:complete len:422 (-),score=68.98 INCI16927.1:268-1533(-)
MRGTVFGLAAAAAGLGVARGDDVPTYSITDFGAVGDGKFNCTDAINRAMQNVSDGGVGGKIVFPAGTWFTAPFNVTSDLELFFDAGATLKASQVFDDWPIIPPMPSYGQGRDHPGPRRSSLIHGVNVSNVKITGNNGTLDGGGQVWWDNHESGKEVYTRGHLIEIMWSKNIEVSNLFLTNSPFWTVHPVYVDGFVARGLTIVNPVSGAPNTDGIDPDSTSNVLIEDCYIRTGDDAIAIKSGWDEFGYGYNVSSSNITIRNMVLSSPCCAAVCIGSEMSGGVANVSVSNVTIWDSAEGLRLKAGAGRGGYIHDIFMTDSTITSTKAPFMYNCNYGGHPAGYNKSAIPDVAGIHVSNTTGSRCALAADLEGLEANPMRDITFEHVHIGTPNPIPYKCTQVSGTFSDMTPKPCKELAPASAPLL